MVKHQLIMAALLAGSTGQTVAGPVAAQSRSISASDRAQGAQANPQLLQEYGGRYSGPQAAYVDRVGKRVAVQSGLSNAQSDFTIALLDSPVENAFAIPGGYVYVTRQLLALMNSEAELAFVLGHEVGHVAARHSAGRQRTSTIGSVLAGVVGAVAGNSALGQLAGAGARTGAQLVTLGYGRNQEYQADALGVRYITSAGYDPYSAPDMLAALDAETKLSAQIEGKGNESRPSWTSTHPNGADRVDRAFKLARETGRPEPPVTQDVQFLRMLDGLAYDDSPAQGIVDRQTFRHPGLRIRFTAPTGYTIANGTDAVTVAGSGGQAQMKSGAKTDDVAGFTSQQLRALGATSTGEIQTGSVNGLRFAAQTVRANASGRAIDATVVAFAGPSSTPWFLMLTPSGSGPGPFAEMINSVAPLSASEASSIRGKRIRIHTVKAGDTIQSLSSRMAYGDYQRDRFETLNGLSNDDQLRPGMLVKLVVAD